MKPVPRARRLAPPLFLTLWAALAASAPAWVGRPPWRPPLWGSGDSPDGVEACGLGPDELERRGAVIGEVAVVVKDIFDPDDPREDNALFRLANRFHRNTRPEVIERQLLFAPGDRYSRRLLDESERLLRRNRYLYDADIRAVRCAGQRVDLEVVTRDVWTINLGGGAGRSGGENSVSFKAQDNNLLGLGKSVTLERNADVDRDGYNVRYEDANLMGTWLYLEATYTDNNDGEYGKLILERPFYSLDTRRAAGITVIDDDRVDKLYAVGEVKERFRHRESLIEVEGGLSGGLQGGWSRRWIAGYTYEGDRFALAPGAQGPAEPAELPPDRTLSYPWLGIEWVEDAFRETHDLDQICRTEDLHLGGSLRLRLGWSSGALGADVDGLVLDGRARGGFSLHPDHTLLVGGGVNGRWEGEGFRNLLASGSVRYYWRNVGRHLFFASLDADVAHELDAERQLLLGGDSGLRGYRLRYQDGDRRVLLTLEQRFFTGWYPLRLGHVGAAVFVDMGRTWANEDSLSPNLGLLRDVGFGLRLASSRSGYGSLLHLDVAFPVDGDRFWDEVQFLVTAKETF